MNFSFTLKTRKKMNPEIILGNVQANLNYQLLAIELEFPRVVFMLENESSRAVELLRTDDGYEVRLPLMSSIPDLRAALILVDFLMYAAGVKSFQALGKTFFSTSAFWNEKNLNFLMETFTEKMRSAILRSPDRLRSPAPFPVLPSSLFLQPQSSPLRTSSSSSSPPPRERWPT